MSQPNVLNPVLAALPANPGKPQMPSPTGDSGAGSEAFATVLQQKINRLEASPPAGKAADSAAPTDPAIAAPVIADNSPLPMTMDAAPMADPSLTALLAATQTAQDAGAAQGLPSEAPPDLPFASADAALPGVLLSAEQNAGQVLAGQIQLAQNAAPTLTTAVAQAEEHAQRPAAKPIFLPTAEALKTENPQAAMALETANLAASLPQEATTAGLQSDNVSASFVQALHQQMNQAGEKAAAQAATSTQTLNTPVGSQAWPAEIGERLVWMSNRHESRAELILTPPQLGKIEVSLNISGDQASVNFVSANPQVRDALEGAINRLREVLAENGISLGQAHVGAESSSAWAREDRQGMGHAGRHDAAELEPLVAQPTVWQRGGTGMVDTFA